MLLKSSNRSLVKERGTLSSQRPYYINLGQECQQLFFKEFHGYGFKRVPLYGMLFPAPSTNKGIFLLGIASNFALL